MRRRRPRSSWALIGLSFLVAAAATLVLRGHLERLAAQAAAAGPGRPVVVAATDLERGAVLGTSALRVVEVPERYLPPGALSSVEEAAGRTLGASVVTGEPVTEARLAPPGGPVAALVPEGLRAVPVAAPVPPGSVVPGDRVDVLATFAGGRSYAETVVEEAEILAVLDPGPTAEVAGPTVVLLVGPATAEDLAYARAFADLSLAVAPAEGAG
jgi:pilus assembly protein CpaB